MRGGILKRLHTPAGLSFLALLFLLGGGLSLMVLDDDEGLTRLTSATSREDLGVAKALVQVTPDPDIRPATSTDRVRPIVECVDRTSDDAWIAYFSYQNPNDDAVEVPIGVDNRLDPPVADGSQPSMLSAGTHSFDFALTLDPGSAISWSLQGRTVTAGTGSPECDFGAYDDVALPQPI